MHFRIQTLQELREKETLQELREKEEILATNFICFSDRSYQWTDFSGAL